MATKFPNLTKRFLDQHNIHHSLIAAEGTLETAPTIGYADIISDLVSSGQTLKDNRLRALPDGLIQPSQAALIATRKTLQTHPEVLEMARRLLEYIEAHLRAKDNLLVPNCFQRLESAGVARCLLGLVDARMTLGARLRTNKLWRRR